MASTRKTGADRGATPAEIAKIVALRDKHGLAFNVIGSRLGISAPTVGVLYRQAKQVPA